MSLAAELWATASGGVVGVCVCECTAFLCLFMHRTTRLTHAHTRNCHTHLSTGQYLSPWSKRSSQIDAVAVEKDESQHEKVRNSFAFIEIRHFTDLTVRSVPPAASLVENAPMKESLLCFIFISQLFNIPLIPSGKKNTPLMSPYLG